MSNFILSFESGKVTSLDKEITDDIVLEETYNDEIITAIGSGACYSGKLKTLDLSRTSIISLEKDAFYGCYYLTSILSSFVP